MSNYFKFATYRVYPEHDAPYQLYKGPQIIGSLVSTDPPEEFTCKNVSDFNSVDRFRCSECDETFKVMHFEGTDAGWLMSGDADEFEFTPKFCPNCGAKVVD